MLTLLLLLAVQTTSSEDARLRFGDDPAWAAPAFSDSDWQRTSIYALPDTQAVFWVRLPVTVSPQTERPIGLSMSILAAYDVYWDGVLLIENGTVGSSANQEEPGLMDLAIPVPDSLAAPGRHLLALRISTFHLPASLVSYVYSAYAGSYQAMANRRSRLMPLVFLGGFLIIGVFYGVLFGLDRRRLTLLLVSGLCFSVVALLMAESWREALGYTTDVHIVRLWLVTGLTGLVSLLLAGTFLVQFRVPRGGWWAGLLIASMGAALFVPGFDTKSLFVIGLGLAVALGATGWALVRR
ncbi:MAG: hypothetical protein AAGI08_17255, partial [Bacteroidota bacterium]